MYAFWEQNLPALRALRGVTNGSNADAVHTIIATLKGKARTLGWPAKIAPDNGANKAAAAPRSELALPKERRLRDKVHLAFVASQPCLICGRRPSHAHHLRFAQQRAMGLKVSDEFTVPLCNGHHDELHRTGDERAWWARHGIIEPLKMAARFWAASRGGMQKVEASMPQTSLDADALPAGDKALAPPTRSDASSLTERGTPEVETREKETPCARAVDQH